MRWLMKTILPPTVVAGSALRASSEATSITWASTPSSEVPTLPPRATAISDCAVGPASVTSTLPRTQRGTSTSCVRTREKPRLASLLSAQRTAAASPVEPAERGPTSVTSELTCSYAEVPDSARSRNAPAVASCCSLQSAPPASAGASSAHKANVGTVTQRTTIHIGNSLINRAARRQLGYVALYV